MFHYIVSLRAIEKHVSLVLMNLGGSALGDRVHSNILYLRDKLFRPLGGGRSQCFNWSHGLINRPAGAPSSSVQSAMREKQVATTACVNFNRIPASDIPHIDS
jgi:hypothetical protein